MLERDITAGAQSCDVMRDLPLLLQCIRGEFTEAEKVVFAWRERAVQAGHRYLQAMGPALKAGEDLTVYASARQMLQSGQGQGNTLVPLVHSLLQTTLSVEERWHFR